MSSHWVYSVIYAFINYFCSKYKSTYLTNSSSAIGGSHSLFKGSRKRLYRRARALWLFVSQLKSSYSVFLLLFLRPLKNYRKRILIMCHSLCVSFYEYTLFAYTHFVTYLFCINWLIWFIDWSWSSALNIDLLSLQYKIIRQCLFLSILLYYFII
jgi:hypothetical protein